MYIIRGKCFGYFIASSYSCPFFLSLVLVQAPMLLSVAVAMLLACDAYFLAGPSGLRTLSLLVVVAFSMQYIFWRCVGKAIAAKFFAVWEVGRVGVPFIWFPSAASSCTRFAAISCQRPTL